MQQETQAYATKGFFPTANMDRDSYLRLIKAREAACRDFIKTAQQSLVPILEVLDLKEFAGKKYQVEVGTVPNCELLAVENSPIPHIRIEYAEGTPEYRERKNPILDLREGRQSERAGAYKTFIHYNCVDIPVVVTTKREGVRVGYSKGEQESITPDSIHELIHAARSDLDFVGIGSLLVELFSQQFDVEEQMAGLYQGLRDARPKPYVQYYPQFDADSSGRCVITTFPAHGIEFENLGKRPTQRIRNAFQGEICKQHTDYKQAREFLERLATEALEGLFFCVPEYRRVFFIKPKDDSIEKRIITETAKKALRTEDSITRIADELGYVHTKFLRVVSRLTYQEANTVSDKLNESIPLDRAIAETVQPWRMRMFEELLARSDEVELVKAPSRIGEDALLLYHAMTGEKLEAGKFNDFMMSAFSR